MVFRDMFRRGPSQEELAASTGKISLPPESPVLGELQAKMEGYLQRVEGLLDALEKPSGAGSKDITKPVENMLFELYKYHIRLKLVQAGSVDKELLAAELRNRHPVKFPSFNEYWFDQAFGTVKADIEIKLRRQK